MIPALSSNTLGCCRSYVRTLTMFLELTCLSKLISRRPIHYPDKLLGVILNSNQRVIAQKVLFAIKMLVWSMLWMRGSIEIYFSKLAYFQPTVSCFTQRSNPMITVVYIDHIFCCHICSQLEPFAYILRYYEIGNKKLILTRPVVKISHSDTHSFTKWIFCCVLVWSLLY